MKCTKNSPQKWTKRSPKYGNFIVRVNREIKQSTEANIYKRFKTQPINDESKIIANQLLEAADNKTIKLRNHILRLNPEEIGIFIRIISGHNNLNYHLERIGYS